MYRCSVFCSFYNGEKFIKGYLEDVLKQNLFNEIEFIFLDCASTQNEKAQIIPLTQIYPNIKYYHLDTDPGLYACWNKAVALCSADIIGNWNIDERKSSNSFDILLKRFEQIPDLDLAYGITYETPIENEKYEDNNYTIVNAFEEPSLHSLLSRNSPHCMPMWKKSIHERFGNFDESYYSAADFEMWLRICVGGARISAINHPIGLYYRNPTGRSSNPKTLQVCYEEIHKIREKYSKKLLTTQEPMV